MPCLVKQCNLLFNCIKSLYLQYHTVKGIMLKIKKNLNILRPFWSIALTFEQITEASIVLYFFIIVYFMSNLANQYLFMKKVDPYHAYHSRDPEKQIISLFILEFVIFLYTSTVLEKIAFEWHYWGVLK